MKKIKVLTSLVGVSALTAAIVPTIASCGCSKSDGYSVELTSKNKEKDFNDASTFIAYTFKVADDATAKATKVKMVSLYVDGAETPTVSGLLKTTYDSAGNISVVVNSNTLLAQWPNASKFEFSLLFTNKDNNQTTTIDGFVISKATEPVPTGDVIITFNVDSSKASCNKETVTIAAGKTFADALFGVVVTPVNENTVCEGWRDENGNLVESTKIITGPMTVTASIVNKDQPVTQQYVVYTPIYEDGKLTSYSAAWNTAATPPTGPIDLTIANEINGKPVTEIGDVDLSTFTGGFMQNQYIKSVTIPKNVKTIGMASFGMCLSLQKVVFDQGSQLTTIKDEAFYGCGSLANINLPDTLLFAGDGSFEACNDALFLKDAVTHAIYLKQDQNGTNDHYVCIDNEDGDITELSTDCKIYCCGVLSTGSTLTFPASLVSICGDVTAYNATKILFEDNSQLKYVSAEAFDKSSCSSLTEIKLPDNVELLGNPFTGHYAEDISIDFGTNSKYKIKDVDGNKIIYDELEDGNIELVSFLSGTDGAETYTIPNTVEKIADYAFANSNIKDVVFPEDNKIVSVGEGAFYNCYGITKVDFTNWKNLVTVPGSCFFRCKNVKQIIFGTDNKIKVLGNDCLSEITDGQIDLVTIPNTLDTIIHDAFTNSNISKIAFENPKGSASGSNWNLIGLNDETYQKETKILQNSELTDTAKNAAYLKDLRENGGYSDWSWNRVKA